MPCFGQWRPCSWQRSFLSLGYKLSFRPQFPLHRTDLLNPSLSGRFAVRAYAATIPPGKMAAPQES
jgi:hypothetical protein